MNKTNSTYNLIHEYLNNRLSIEGRVLFEKRLEQDANFKQYFENHKLANDLIVAGELVVIKEKLKSIHKKEIVKKLILKIVMVIVLLLVILSVSILVFEVDEKVENEKVEKVEEKDLEELELVEAESQETNESLGHKVIKERIKDSQSALDTIRVEVFVLDSSTNEKQEIIHKDTLRKQIVKNVLINSQENQEEDSLSKVNEKKCEERFWVSFEIEKVIPSIKTESQGSFEFSLLDENYNYSISEGKFVKRTSKFENLKAGTYNLIAIDNEGCKSFSQEVEIPILETDFVIYPNQYQFWNISLESFIEQEKIDLKIYSAKSGALVYNVTLDVFQENVWRGDRIGGQQLPMGNYVYELKSLNKVIRGNVTIVK